LRRLKKGGKKNKGEKPSKREKLTHPNGIIGFLKSDGLPRKIGGRRNMERKSSIEEQKPQRKFEKKTLFPVFSWYDHLTEKLGVKKSSTFLRLGKFQKKKKRRRLNDGDGGGR